MAEEAAIEQKEAPEPAVQETKASNKEANLAALRRQRDEERARREAVEAEIAAIKAQISQMQPAHSHAASDPYSEYGIEKGGLVESEKLLYALQKEREKMEREFEKKAETISQKTYAKIEQARFKEKLHQKYPDYSSVVNEDTIQEFFELNPDDAEVAQEIPDLYKKGEYVYKKIKALEKQKAPAHKVNAQAIVDANANAAHHYAPNTTQQGSGTTDWRSFHTDPDAKMRAYQRLKAAQKRLG